jgi:hypothetical protein
MIDSNHIVPSAPSPARHGGCKKTATAAPLALSRYAGEGSWKGFRQGEPLPSPTTRGTRDLQKEPVDLFLQLSRRGIFGKASTRDSHYTTKTLCERG